MTITETISYFPCKPYCISQHILAFNWDCNCNTIIAACKYSFKAELKFSGRLCFEVFILEYGLGPEVLNGLKFMVLNLTMCMYRISGLSLIRPLIFFLHLLRMRRLEFMWTIFMKQTSICHLVLSEAALDFFFNLFFCSTIVFFNRPVVLSVTRSCTGEVLELALYFCLQLLIVTGVLWMPSNLS